MGTYTDEVRVEAASTVTISDSSAPSSSQVSTWIQEVEAWVAEKALGSHTATNEYLDVPHHGEEEKLYNWDYNIKNERLVFHEGQVFRVPLTGLKRPLISITSLAKNDEAYDQAASWDTLTEGPGEDSSFILRQTGSKQHGYELVFYDNQPLPGPKRLRLTYFYGHNISGDILSEYCSKVVAIEVLAHRMGTNSVDGLSYVDAGDFGVAFNTRYVERIERLQKRVDEIKAEFFPQPGERAGSVFTTMQ